MNVDLPEPLGPEQAENFSCAHVDVDPVQCAHAPKRLPDAARHQDAVGVDCRSPGHDLRRGRRIAHNGRNHRHVHFAPPARDEAPEHALRHEQDDGDQHRAEDSLAGDREIARRERIQQAP